MKKLVLVLMCLALVGVTAANAQTPINKDLVQKVFVKVDPSLAMANIGGPVNLDSIGLGKFNTGTKLKFRVDANKESLVFSVAATNLYKGDDPASQFQIPLDTELGALVQPTNANPMGSRSPVLAFNGGPTTVDQYPGVLTEAVPYESGTNNNFSQDVTVTVGWNHTNPELPMGEYSGKVKFIALLQ